jgi:hypothetical protein
MSPFVCLLRHAARAHHTGRPIGSQWFLRRLIGLARSPISEDEAVMGKYVAIGSLLVLLAFVLWVVYQQWVMVVVDIPAWGWAAIILGGGLSLAVGFGLMALMYYSERQGYDEPSRRIDRDK